MMRRLVSLLFALSLLTSVACPAETGDIRVLLTFGGHGFQKEPFFAMFDVMPGVKYTKAELPKDADLLRPALKKDYDVVVMYDMVRKFTPKQQKAFVDLLNSGIGLVSMHHNMGAHRDWPEFREIIGGKFCFSGDVIDGKEVPKSTWSHDEDLKVAVVDKEHPITRGLGDFQIHDETYGKYYTDPKVRVLLKTDHPKNDPELAWVKQYGKSRVFYFMLGHDRQAWQNPNYLKVLLRGIRWAAGRPVENGSGK